MGAESPGFDHIGDNTCKLLGEEVIRLDQMFRELALDVDTHTERSRRFATLDFASDPDADDVVSRMHAYHRGGMAT